VSDFYLLLPASESAQPVVLSLDQVQENGVRAANSTLFRIRFGQRDGFHPQPTLERVSVEPITSYRVVPS
jgi:hypothetical protein